MLSTHSSAKSPISPSDAASTSTRPYLPHHSEMTSHTVPYYSATHLVPVKPWSYCFNASSQKNTLMQFCPMHLPCISKARSLEDIRNDKTKTSKHFAFRYSGAAIK